MTKRLNNKNLIKKILASLVIFITTTLFLLWYAYAADWEYDYNRHITINLNGGSAGEMPIRYQVDYTGEGHTAGDWLDKEATPIGQKFIDKHGNSHTVADLRAPDRFGTPITTSVSEGTNYQRMDFVGTTPYIFIKNPTRAGYTFAGWELNFTNSTPSSYPPGYSPSDGYTAFNIGAWTRNSDNGSYLTITATWTANAPSTYTMNITYDSGVASVSGAGTYNCNSIATIGATPKPGYSIAYAKDLDSGAVWYGNDMWDWTMYANRHIYFATTPNTYTVTYDANGGTGAPAAQNFKYNSGERISTIKPTRSGYAFVNWAYGSTRFNPGDAIPSGWGSFTLTAQWKANTYTVTYNSNKPSTASTTMSGTTANSSHTYDTASLLTTNGFVLPGYTFTGWNTKADGTGTSYTNEASVKNLTTKANGTVILYAQWIDDIKPTKEISINPATWTNENTIVTATGNDNGSGIAYVYIQMYKDNAWTTVATSENEVGSVQYSCSDEGKHSFRSYSVDKAGNVSSYSATIYSYIDKTLPTGKITAGIPNSTGDIVLSFTGTDPNPGKGCSEVKNLKLYREYNGNTTLVKNVDTNTTTLTVNEENSVRYVGYVTDNAGNISQTIVFNLYKQTFSHCTFDTPSQSYKVYNTTSQVYGENTICNPALYKTSITGYNYEKAAASYTVTSEKTSEICYLPIEYNIHFVNEYYGTTNITVKYDQLITVSADNKTFDVTLDYSNSKIANTVMHSVSPFIGYKDTNGIVYTKGSVITKLSSSPNSDVYLYSVYGTAQTLTLPEIPDTSDEVSIGWCLKKQAEGKKESNITTITPTQNTTVYAYWNLRPVLNNGTTNGYYRDFFNGQSISVKELLFNISYNDKEDTGLSIKVQQVVFKKKDGSLETVSMFSSTDKYLIADCTGYYVTYYVEDKGTAIGIEKKKVASSTSTTKWYDIKENIPPVITTVDKYIFTQDALITENNIVNILTTAQKVTDEEYVNDVSYWIKAYNNQKVTIENITYEDVVYTDNIAEKLIEIKNLGKTTDVSVMYTVKDLFGASSTAMGKVFFINTQDDSDISEFNSYKSIRFISLDAINTLNPASNWKYDTFFNELLLNTLSKDEDSEVKSEGVYETEDGKKVKYKRYY